MATADELGEEIASLAAHLDAATGRLLTCIRGFDQEGGWEKQGAVSCAHWLSWRIGIDLPTAREKVRVARALGSLRAIDEALGCGELSYAKVRALTRIATPDNELRLLELARHATGAQLERICRGYRQVAASLADEGPLAEERSFRERLLPGGMVRLEIVVDPDEAALIRQAIEKARADLRERPQADPVPAGQISGRSLSPASPDGTLEVGPAIASTALNDHTNGGRHGAEDRGDVEHVSAGIPQVSLVEAQQVSLVEAAVHLAESFLASGDVPGGGGGNGGERYQIFVHLDEDVLGEPGDWAATLDDGTRLPAETLRRLACDCGLVPTRTSGEGSVLDVGRRTRSIPPAIRRALWVRDRGCRFPGCGHIRFLHGHHLHHWLAGGETRLDNLVLVCSRHHRLLHEGGWSIEGAADAGLIFRTGDGKRLATLPDLPAVDDARADLQAWAAEHGLELGPDTNLPWWDGAVPDYDWVVSSLIGEGPACAAREGARVQVAD